jgi:hypothetical protein
MKETYARDSSWDKIIERWKSDCPNRDQKNYELATDLTIHCLKSAPNSYFGARRSSWTNVELNHLNRSLVLAAIDIKANGVSLSFRLQNDMAEKFEKERLLRIEKNQNRRGGKWVHCRVPDPLTLQKAKELLGQSFSLELAEL